jgi:hypothetical protein
MRNEILSKGGCAAGLKVPSHHTGTGCVANLYSVLIVSGRVERLGRPAQYSIASHLCVPIVSPNFCIAVSVSMDCTVQLGTQSNICDSSPN